MSTYKIGEAIPLTYREYDKEGSAIPVVGEVFWTVDPGGMGLVPNETGATNYATGLVPGVFTITADNRKTGLSASMEVTVAAAESKAVRATLTIGPTQ